MALFVLSIMRTKLKFLLAYFLGWMALFAGFRLILLVYDFEKAGDIAVSTLLLTFWYGARMDASMASYILVPVCLFVVLSLWIGFFRKLLIYKIYTYIILFLIALLSLFDLEIFKQWGFRIDATPLTFLTTPREAYTSVSHMPLVSIFLVFCGGYLLLALGARYLLGRTFFKSQKTYKAFTLVALLLFMGVLIVPIRGGFQLAPLNQSSVYFSTSNFANQAAVNAPWNFMHSVLSRENSLINPYLYFSEENMKRIVDSLYQFRETTRAIPAEPLINPHPDTPLNIIIVIWESFTEKAIHASIAGKEVTPQFTRLMGEGVYFSNIYASGDRTNKGISAILSGYPAMPGTSIVHSPAKSGTIEVLSRLFKNKGYRAPFFYGGEPEFANIKSYLLQGGFDPIIGKYDFSKKDMNSKWGAHDGVVMKRVFEDLQASPKPFFATWLTLSSHEPFETPVPVVFEGSDNTTRFLNSLHYTDKCVGELIEKCSREPWWDNTVMIITGDHGHPLPATNNKAEDFRIPLLWVGGALNKKGIVIDKIASQLDIAATLAQQVGITENPFPFSRNIMDERAESWAFFSFNNGFGFVNNAGRLVFDNVGKIPILQQGRSGNKEIEAGQAMQQYTYGDFLKR